MDWPTAVPMSVSIVSGVILIYKFVGIKTNNKQYKSYQSTTECNRRHDALETDIGQIKGDITTIKVDIGTILGRLEKE